MLDDFFHVEGKCRGKACLLLEWVFEQKPQNSSPEPAIISQDHSPEIEAAVPHIFEQVLSEQVEVQSGRVHTTVI